MSGTDAASCKMFDLMGGKSNISETALCILGTDGTDLSSAGRQSGAAPLMGREEGGRSRVQATTGGAGISSTIRGVVAGMDRCAEEKIREFVAASYTLIEGMVQAHIAADEDGKRVIETHIAAIFDEIVAVEVLAELLELGA
ncbi:hypothetical protein QMO56_04430 [Roseomonas sp. E05]|uniref:hypothetical protein n=1 Tax=Roseomonas sp. E05 TaxID=3046310 RepID=UPI0024B9031A|nr:hypothetical protein [Roseomonas sp. E05]MDJ0387351.1 hypothetical protein [Roseomonas sp. E05]